MGEGREEDMGKDTIIQPALLPCPLCQVGNVTVAHVRAGVEWWSVECGRDEDGCGLSICRSTRASAVAAWNTRSVATRSDEVRQIAQKLAETFHHESGTDGKPMPDDWQDFVPYAQAALSMLPAAQPAPVEQDVEQQLSDMLDRADERGWSDIDHFNIGSFISQNRRYFLSTLTPARTEGFKAGVEAAAKLMEADDFKTGDFGLRISDFGSIGKWLAAVRCTAIRALKESDHG